MQLGACGIETVRAAYAAARRERVDEGEQLGAVPKQREHVWVVALGEDGRLGQQLRFSRSRRLAATRCSVRADERHQPLDGQRAGEASVGWLQIGSRLYERIGAVHDGRPALADGACSAEGGGDKREAGDRDGRSGAPLRQLGREVKLARR